MATYGKGFSVSGAIATSGTGNAVLYTVPANSFAIIQYWNGSNVTGQGSITVGGQQVMFDSQTLGPQVFVAGPGQAIQLAAAIGTHRISGVLFTNS